MVTTAQHSYQSNGKASESEVILGLPKPQGWTLERATSLVAGAAVLTTLALGRRRSPKWRLLTTVIGANLVLNGLAGWCPASVAMHKLGLRTGEERACARS